MPLSSDPEKRARQEAALRKGNPKAFTKTPPGESAPKPSKSAKPKKATVRASAPPASPKARKPRAAKAADAPAQERPREPFYRRGFLGGLLDG